MFAALAGGVGAARLLSGLVRAVDPAAITAIVNTGDDVVLHGLHVSPDLDTVTYTLAGEINPETGWGLRHESWQAMATLARYGARAAQSGRDSITWFNLGDRDLGTHLYRTHRLRDGATLTDVTAEIARAWGVALRVLPATDDRVETRVTIEGEGEVGFQEYFVQRRHSVAVTSVRFAGADAAKPGPGVLDAIASAERVIVCPSNPILSIGPMLAVPGVRDAVVARRDDCVAVSPIVAGAALKGPADRLLRELGHESSVVGVARLYAPLASTLVVDEADAALAGDVEAEGLRCVVAPTIMSSPDAAEALARTVLSA